MRLGICALRQASGYWSRSSLVLGRPLASVTRQKLAERSIPLGSRWLTYSGKQDDAAVAVGHKPEVADGRLQALRALARKLPLSCPGCGAPSQTVSPTEAGHYTLTRSGVKSHLNEGSDEEDKAFDAVIKSADKDTLQQLGLKDSIRDEKTSKGTPICDRCHNLIHHHTGVPIYHPSIQSIQDIIEESPYKENHIYHVIDAADFPMSLIPNLQRNLDLPRLRTQNRRSKSQRWVKGRIAEVSFIITRSDLLAPKKEQVDTLMPYLRETLRDALGRSSKNVRMGNVRCVSAKRGWWTKEVKEDIWKRGGAGWMVGKVNVGKSNLFEVVYPKGRNDDVNLDKLRHAANRGGTQRVDEEADLQPSAEEAFQPFDQSTLLDLPGDLDQEASEAERSPNSENETVVREGSHDEDNAPDTAEAEIEPFDEDDMGPLLPPAQPETAYPTMPVISSLPGTTASPIRVPFGNGKGELIDLPGVARSQIEGHVKAEHRQDLVMRTRVSPEQYTIKPGQSLLLGGLIRITPTTPDLVFLAYPFLPLHPHITSTEKAVGIETGERETGLKTIMEESARAKYAKAGSFKLEWDVTKKRAGPLTSPTAVKLKAEQLHFVVYSADILIEGVGWVELVAQMRKKPQRRPVQQMENSEESVNFSPLVEAQPEEQAPLLPEFEVFSPEGKFIAIRPPMNAWLLGGKKPVPRHLQKSRPRKSMRSLKGSVQGRETR